MKEAVIILPNQLFKDHPGITKTRKIILIEEPKFFTEFTYHKQKLILLRAAMQYYYHSLQKKGYAVTYVPYNKKPSLQNYTLFMLDPIDHELEKKYNAQIIETPGFLNSRDEIKTFFKDKKKFLMNVFYIDQRKKRNILIQNNTPIGGKWSFDSDNRKKMPADTPIPPTKPARSNIYTKEAIAYINRHFKKNYGSSDTFIYPVTHSDAEKWLDTFLKEKLSYFGTYQDAMLAGRPFLFHSLLSPLINIGLLTPAYIIEKTIAYAKKNTIPINCLEGFIRQIIGWREFMRAVYLLTGKKQNKLNFWNHKRKLSDTFYDGTTGIEPIDDVIKRVLKYAYCHHIERLMVLGNFMLLAQINPDHIYQWFMELFIDSYEWVMIPNVYGMSQYADGGMMTTKPYISGSNYIKKMSNFPSGDWCTVWDGLYWNFIKTHSTVFQKSPRMALMASLFAKMNPKKRNEHIAHAQQYLNKS